MVGIYQSVARLQASRNLKIHTSTACPLRLGVRVNLKGMGKQVTKLCMYMTSTHGNFLSISRKFQLVDEVHHAVFANK